MSQKEFRVDYDLIDNPDTITKVQQRIFNEHDRDVKRHECDITDDHDRKQRIFKVDSERKYFFMKK